MVKIEWKKPDGDKHDAGFVLDDLELVYYVELVRLGIDVKKLEILKALNFENESSDRVNNPGFGISASEYLWSINLAEELFLVHFVVLCYLAIFLAKDFCQCILDVFYD